MVQSLSRGVDLHEILLIELHHRFYNSLQVIASLASGLSRGDPCGAARRRSVGDLQQRIAVIAQLHRLLAEPHGDDLRRSCETLCRTLASAYDRSDLDLRLSLPPAINPVLCRGLMLMLAELVTNALKHAPTQIPLTLEIALRSSCAGYDLAVRNPASGQAHDAAFVPRVASQLATKFGGILTADAHDGYQVHVIIPAAS